MGNGEEELYARIKTPVQQRGAKKEASVTFYIVSILVLVPFLVAVVIFYLRWPYVNISVTEIENNNQFAIKSFVGLLEAAENHISIYDDGNKMDGSIYENEEVIQKVKDKLEGNSDFWVQCSFNEKEGTMFVEEFRGHERVMIKLRERPALGLAHYKIIDDGKKAYLSWHDPGSENRKVKVYDFSKAKKGFMRKDVKEEYIGDCLKDIEREFKLGE